MSLDRGHFAKMNSKDFDLSDELTEEKSFIIIRFPPQYLLLSQLALILEGHHLTGRLTHWQLEH